MIWKDIPAHPGYQVSDAGVVRNGRTGQVFKGFNHPTGYHKVTIRVSGRVRGHSTHRLVLAAFLGPCTPGFCVDHINRNRLDNRLENLRYLPISENCKQGGPLLKGLPKPDGFGAKISKAQTGMRHSGVKLTDQQIVEIRQLRAAGSLQKELAARFGVCRSLISLICSHKLWSHIS